ncbi:MAG TPA: NBR1-Ig-like domain-containing protein [Anaerolineales bacterium]|nr:NBR1-Ig-like domain-containing protein [Anaerolineales bacterium]
MNRKYLLRAITLLVLLVSFLPASSVSAQPSTAPPADFFQLPWDQGVAWVAIDGIDNGTKRPLSSSHHFSVGGAIDFAPRSNMVKGEDTSNFWTAAAGPGTVVGISRCHIIIDHRNGWITQYQFLANIQVQLGDQVERNQRLGIIADGVRNPFCPGSQDPNVPHLHFMLRPTIIGATFAGWTVNYLPVLSKTTFVKNGQAVGLFKPLLNVFDAPPTATPTATQTLTTTPSAETPTATPSPTGVNSPTPTLFGPYVSTTVDPLSILINETALATVGLHNVPVEGYTSAEFTCSFSANVVEVSNITVSDLFGSDAAVAINGPQGNSFIVAIAGSNGNKATTSGIVFTFDVKGLQVGDTNLGCEARVSQGDNVLTQLPSARTFLTVLSTEDTPTPNLTPGTPTVLPSACDRAEFIADVNVPPGTVISPATTFTKTWRLKNLGPCTWTTSYSLVFFHGDSMGAPSSMALTQSVEAGETVDISINLTAPNAPGAHRGYWMFRNASGINFGIGPEANQPWFVDINVSGPTLPPSLTPTPLPSSPTPTITSDVPTATLTPTSNFPPPVSETATATPIIPGDWLTFTNLLYGFEFRYPPQGVIADGRTDGFARIDLPFEAGTNLREKYVEVIVQEDVVLCQSPLQTPNPGESVTINGISFLKQTGSDAGVGHLHQWVAYSTLRDNVCVSLDFILHSLNPGNFATPPPEFDFAAESAVFEQIVSTYTWLSSSPTATPTIEETVISESPTPTVTSTPVESPTFVASPTATQTSGAVLTGQVIASKVVTVRLFDLDENFVAVVNAEPDGTFSFNLSAGTYTIIATANGFLRAEGQVTLTEGESLTMPVLNLLAGDIDDNGDIDQFDAMTIGMNYNSAFPEAADLNSDGVINVLDLELLARNYRATGPTPWE